jgi:hypothetical protein
MAAIVSQQHSEEVDFSVGKCEVRISGDHQRLGLMNLE